MSKRVDIWVEGMRMRIGTPDKGRCMVCGQLYSEHTPEEQAGGCKR